ncbi:glycosyltransferase [Rathayibacter tanaceti]|uniref:GDP-mannose-dependent alpha-(1-6)-phosphatidylinositol monomannoside mannosyltransferase n=2 Tax=Rathayibacter tanaceti TaxID=1671680 RepID=A0A166HT34_9MICO|nr:glycosyltransferase [Rathayibacter tanaceti]KZX21124.1 GDP-mannose-dependent alpha-(1-6)-phosphatidylinositol monomannoside mannosyltransferase [Rathayibacter tanaceti]TCO39325.1 glycosyltransferase involved in cell wall biosynthesis [Rathayibacter tanaceti]
MLVWKRAWLQDSETFVRNQMRGLHRWRALGAGLEHTGSGVLREESDRVLYDPISSWQRRALLLRWFGVSRGLDALIAEQRPELIHAHFLTDAAYIARYARRRRIPLVVTGHGYDVTSWPRATGAPRSLRPLARLQRALTARAVFRHAYAVVGVSRFIADGLVRLGADPNRTEVRYIGIPTVADAPSQDASREGVVFVGRLSDKKGVADLLDAMAALPLPLRDVPLTIVGDGHLRAALGEQAARLGLTRATFVGSRPPAEVAEILRTAAVFCAPSLTASNGDAEGFGMVFLEAALAGAPVVSYAHGGVPEAVEDGVTGMLVPEADVTALSTALAALLGDPARAETMGRAGRERVLASFDLSDRIRDLEDLYDRAAGRARSTTTNGERR